MLYESYQDLIGNTPLVRINRFPIPDGVKLYAKLELANPGGSVKDRIGVSMIEDAERRGVLKPGGTIVEGTAGNTGIGIAFAALGRGYRIVFVVPDKFSGEKVALLKALGAEIVRTPRSGGMLLAERRADELAREIPGAVVLGQFHNAANPRAHYETTGPEIWRDLFGRLVEVAGKRLHRAAHVKRMNDQMFFVSRCRQKSLGLFHCQFHVANNPFVKYRSPRSGKRVTTFPRSPASIALSAAARAPPDDEPATIPSRRASSRVAAKASSSETFTTSSTSHMSIVSGTKSFPIPSML